MRIQISFPAARSASPQPAVLTPERPLTYSGAVLPQSSDLPETVLLGRLLALAQLTPPRRAVLFSLSYPVKKPTLCIMEERESCLPACLPVIYIAKARRERKSGSGLPGIFPKWWRLF